MQTRLPGSGIVQLSVGTEFLPEFFGERLHVHTLAPKSDGTVWALGDHSYGQLGDGSTSGPAGPVQVTGLAGVTQVTVRSPAGFTGGVVSGINSWRPRNWSLQRRLGHRADMPAPWIIRPPGRLGR